MQVFTGIVRDLSEMKAVHAKLVQSERLAAIGEMMTGLAHESRNALQRTRACLDMLELDLEEQPEAIDLIRRGQTALDELHRLYEEVRGYAAPVQLSPAPCNLAHVWETAWANLSDQRRDRAISLQTETNGVDLECRVDAHRIGQVLRNLFENSIAACSEPGKIVLQCANAVINGAPAVELTLIDNGPGFDEEQRNKAFEPFFTTKTKGTGLGMAIAKRIIDAHNGRIAINSARQGAEIVITLPREIN